jgi:leucyl/phenylalanyl-tRNA---protein transferase
MMTTPFTVPRLDERLWFPDPRQAVRAPGFDGLVAWGGDLSVPRLLLAYRSGIFPWTDCPVTWWSPDPRAIIEIGKLHVSRSLARTLRRGGFTVTVDRAFALVVEGCAARSPGREHTWISPAFADAFLALHRAGYAHSVECWLQGVLAGGIYGVAIGGFFAGESMFHRVTDASKVALHELMRRLERLGFALFDIQLPTPVTRLLGARVISREIYLERLAEAVRLPCRFESNRLYPKSQDWPVSG